MRESVGGWFLAALGETIMSDVATQEEIELMVEWFGDHLDRWLAKFLRTNSASSTKQWCFITTYNLLETIQATGIRSTTTEQAACVRAEIASALAQVVACTFVLAQTLGIHPSELIRRGCSDFARFADKRHGVACIHRLRQWALKRTKQGIDTGGNHKKALGLDRKGDDEK